MRVMARTNNYNSQLQRLVQRFRQEEGQGPLSLPDVAKWAIEKGEWQPKQSPEAILAGDLAKALREEHITDPQGRTVRAKHAVRSDQGVLWVWDDIRTAPAEHMRTALQQRRHQIVGDCRQLKNDADSFNENYNTGRPIQLSFDFTEDLAELEASQHREPPFGP